MRCISCGLGYGVHYSFCITMPGGIMEPQKRNVPAQETRGGNRVDWAKAEPGQPLPELPKDDYPEPDSEQLPRVFDDEGVKDDEFWDLGGEG
jgi:hypothetical protein